MYAERGWDQSVRFMGYSGFGGTAGDDLESGIAIRLAVDSTVSPQRCQEPTMETVYCDDSCVYAERVGMESTAKIVEIAKGKMGGFDEGNGWNENGNGKGG